MNSELLNEQTEICHHNGCLCIDCLSLFNPTWCLLRYGKVIEYNLNEPIKQHISTYDGQDKDLIDDLFGRPSNKFTKT